MMGLLHIAEELAAATDNRARAALLLRVPDGILLSYHGQLGGICARHHFEAGVSFLAYRVSALCAVRDAHGLLPGRLAGELEAWRTTMSRFAAGEGGTDAS